MTQILNLIIIADYDRQISEVMNELSRKMSVAKRWLFLLYAAERLVQMQSRCDKERSNNPNRAYESLYESWWEIRNLRDRIMEIKSRRMAIEMGGVIGGGY